jgi:hypothetical protein
LRKFEIQAQPTGSIAAMDPQFYDQVWDTAHEAWRSAKLPRSLGRKHPIVAKWLADDARGGDPAVNPLHFLHRPRFRSRTRLRQLRIFNTLLLTLEREGFVLALDRDRDDSNIAVSHRGRRATLSISAEMTGPIRATSPSRTNLTGRLVSQLEAKLPGGIERRWADEVDAALETRIPNILASFAVWVEHQTGARSPPRPPDAAPQPMLRNENSHRM